MIQDDREASCECASPPPTLGSAPGRRPERPLNLFFHRNDPSDQKSDPQPEGARILPLLPLREIVIFPNMVAPLFVGRERSVRALEEAMNLNKEIFLAAQMKVGPNDPSEDEIYPIGTLGKIAQLLRLPDGTVKVLVEGRARGRIKAFRPNDAFFQCEIELIDEPIASGPEIIGLIRSVKESFEAYTKLSRGIPPEAVLGIQAIEQATRLADAIIAHLEGVKIQDRQKILETIEPKARLEALLALLSSEIEIREVEQKIRKRVKQQMERSQKEYYLNEQMQAIQKELGDRDEFKAEILEIEEQLREHQHLSAEARERVTKELKKLRMMQPMSAEATVIRNYIEWILALPWGKRALVRHDIEAAEAILDDDHHGLKKPKERILEHLAVEALVEKMKGPILCLVGPPGVGKTSLARSIARATDREFVRLSLGGVRDEAEIRGHRRTYIGAMPGRLIQSLRRCTTNNPVFLLDEIDKMSSDFRGDPSSALLEVLDPEQNKSFSDHYLDLDYDLSDVMFIATANSLGSIPYPLRDRMEIIELSGYTEFEKLAIARQYLIPRQSEETGLGAIDVRFDEEAILRLIRRYTREAGVRNLEREIGAICRKLAKEVVIERKAEGAALPSEIHVRPEDIETKLGAPRFAEDEIGRRDEIGLTYGLSVNMAGGGVLECEASAVPGKGRLLITGLLAKGMQESAQAAMGYLRSRADRLGLKTGFHARTDIHVHFPEFVNKDGPSAGITMATSIASALLSLPVRHKVAMTGEITLRGRVLPIGGLKEKTIAAHRAGIETVIIPLQNRKDLAEIPGRVLAELRIVMVEHMDQVLAEAIVFDDVDALFGADRIRPLEMRGGILIDGEQPLEDGRVLPLEATVKSPSAEQ